MVPEVFAGGGVSHDSQVWHTDLVLSPGHIYNVEAASGRGKSSLCAYLYGLRHDYRGIITIGGEDVARWDIRRWCEMRRTVLAYLPQGLELFAELSQPYISGVTMSGGDPLHMANRDEIGALIKEIHETFPDKTIWIYTGYLWEEVKDLPFMPLADVLVDGPFIEEQKDTALHWKGSANQRVIDVKRSLAEGRVVLHA